MKFSGRCLLSQKKILEGFGKVLRIISVGLILDCESNRLYDESILIPISWDLTLNL